MAPRVFLHVGEPKCGTTFLQKVVWTNRAELERRGLVLPGVSAQDHFRAAEDVLGTTAEADNPGGGYGGSWAALARQACRVDGAALISHERLAGATAEQAARALAPLRGTELHLVVTVRDFASLLPAEWQETVKHRNSARWPVWLGRIAAAEPGEGQSAGESGRWFWRAHDTLDLLQRWGDGLPPDRIHVVVVPPRGARPDELWRRFAAVLGVDPDCADLSGLRPNASLGFAETELLRRLNEQLRGQVPDWFYLETIKELVAHDLLAARDSSVRPQLPPQHRQWARARAQRVVARLRELGVRVTGDLDELIPAPKAEQPPGPADGVEPAAVLDAGVAALAGVLREQYEPTSDATRAAGEGVLGRGAALVQSSPAARRRIRQVLNRYPALARVRMLLWRLAERARGRPGG